MQPFKSMGSKNLSSDSNSPAFRISTLIFIRDERQRLLLLHRSNPPNCKKWSPVGGKLDVGKGESPFECAIRETNEETGFAVDESDLHLFSCISEKNYEGAGHWLMFLFSCRKPLPFLPQAGPEGEFGFFDRSSIESMAIPYSDKLLIWPLFDKFAEDGFVAVRADCTISDNPDIKIEEQFQLLNETY